MRGRRRAIAVVVLGVACGVTPLLAHADDNRLTWASPSIAFDGGPLVGTHKDGECLPASCASISISVGDDVASSWANAPGGIVATIQWPDPNVEIDLFAYDAHLTLLDSVNFGGVTSQRVFVANPPAGSYQIWAQAFSGQATSFTGSVRLQRQPTTAHATSTAPTMRFSPPALVDPQMTTGEPGIRMDAAGQSYVDAPFHPSTASSLLWQSQPVEGNLTYEPLEANVTAGVDDPRHRSCSQTVGGGDSDIAVMPNGHLLFADSAVANISVSRSTDNGATWTCSTVTASAPDVDRPWVTGLPTADGNGPSIDAYLVYRGPNVIGQFAGAVSGLAPRIQIDATRDDGLTWAPAASIGDTPAAPQVLDHAPVLVKDPGGPFTDSIGNVYEPFGGPDGRIYVSHTTAGSNSWTTALVASRAGSADYGFLSGATDSAGTAYVAWVDQGTFAVVYSVSHDHGATWSTPTQVSAPGTVNVMPWLAAGRAGDVAISWYGAQGVARPDMLAPNTTWRPVVARSLNASSSLPTFETVALTGGPVHRGALCVPDLPGGACGLKQFGDLFMIAIAPDGQLRATFNADAGAAVPFIETVVQVAGTGLSANAQTAASESRGDAVVAAAAAAALDLTTQPAVSGQTVTMHLADTTEIASANEGYLNGAGSQATWLVTWLGTDGRLNYAGLRSDKANGNVFFGGVGVANTSVGADANYATYPDATPSGATPVTGRISTSDGTIALALPDWLRGDGKLQSLQAWTMLGAQQASEPLPLTVVDSTPPIDASIS
jgi:hypothetical protein